MHIYKYVQSHIVNLHQHISATPVTVIRVAYNKNTINIQITVQRCMMLLLLYKSNVPPNSFIIYFDNYLCIDCILIISHHDYGHRSDLNMLVKNNTV